MTIYALKGNSEWCDILASLENGEGRFGWSYAETANLHELKKRADNDGWESLTDEEKDCCQWFLLDLKKGDYVVYVNIPEWGKCAVAEVTGKYQWKYEDDDFNHRFPVDKNSVYVFDRNDAIVHPSLSSRLKLQSRWWRIYLEDEFSVLLSSLENGDSPKQRTPEVNLQLLSSEIQPFLTNITERIHHTHPNYDFERLISDVFKKVPRVKDVTWQGGAGDHGADVLVVFEGGLPIPGLEKEHTLVVQVKSFEGEHWDTQAVDDIRRAFEYYPQADMGLIISTAVTASESFEKALDQLREESGKPVSLLIGSEVAAFLLRYGANLLA